LDADEPGGAGTIHLLEQLKGYPLRSLAPISRGKDLGELGGRADGYALYVHALHAAGEGGEL
jgi:hypothetical protein